MAKKALMLGIASISSMLALGQTSVQKAAAERGKTVYQQVCASCHMADGNGAPNINPPLRKTPWTMGDKKKPVNVVLKGFSEKAAINGAYYSNNMPSQSNLTDQQIADVLTYVRSNFGNKASAVSPKDVAVQRKLIK